MISITKVYIFQGRKIFVFCALIVLIIFGSLLEGTGEKKGRDDPAMHGHMKKHIILLGASIGRAWNISSLPERINTDDYIFEFVDGGSFDKSVRLHEILTRSQNKPDGIFIKECAAYFPGDFGRYKSLMEQWVRECFEEGIIPIPTTIVPVTRLHSLKKIMIDIVKLRNPLKYGNPFRHRRNAAILEYNDWIRTFCKLNGLSFLDLEAAVRYSKKNRYLKENLAKMDGLHLNKKAYKILDYIVISLLEKMNWEEKKEKLAVVGE